MSVKSTLKKYINKKTLLYILCGMLVGLGAVLPGISGGVLCVIFGIYRPMMGLLSNPVRALKKDGPILVAAVLGIGIGFVAVAKLLGFVLDRYPDQSVCLFVGLIFGMLPLLFKDAGEQGRRGRDFACMGVAFAVILALLITLRVISFTATPNFWWYLFAGFCLALSLIVPGMSFSTLLMPLDLYEPLMSGIGNFDFSVLIPAGIGGLVTVVALAQAVSWLMKRHFSAISHAIIGIVVAATLVIIPFKSFADVWPCVTNIVCFAVGLAVSLAFSKMDGLKKSAEND